MQLNCLKSEASCELRLQPFQLPLLKIHKLLLFTEQLILGEKKKKSWTSSAAEMYDFINWDGIRGIRHFW